MAHAEPRNVPPYAVLRAAVLLALAGFLGLMVGVGAASFFGGSWFVPVALLTTLAVLV